MTTPFLVPLSTLPTPHTITTRSWSTSPHPDPSNPLLAAASSDKCAHIFNLRDFSYIGAVEGGHKRSVRCVGWKDYGRKRRKVGGEDSGHIAKSKGKGKVTLATGSFDANVGIWEYNANANANANTNTDFGDATDDHTMTDDNDGDEIDFTKDTESENDQWHFASLLTGPDSEIKSLAFSPPHYSANLLATSSRDKSVWIWEDVDVDEHEYETVAVGQEHAGDVKCVAWCEGASLDRKGRRKDGMVAENDGGVGADEHEHEHERIVGSREVLASGSYDDTIRLWRDVEEEGDWICVAVIEGHNGTVWDLSWEKHINLSLPVYEDSTDDQIAAEWEPRIMSCSDDLSIRVWRREVSESEKEKKRNRVANGGGAVGGAIGGQMQSRLPSTIRPTGYFEKWNEEAVLPQVHVRSVYAVDWSRHTGLVVSCGGDGTIGVYREIEDEQAQAHAQTQQGDPSTANSTTEDIIMNGTSETPEAQPQPNPASSSKWILIATMEAAHDEYEINHVCWATRRDTGRRHESEEVIVSAGDDGVVKVWCLPEEVVGEGFWKIVRKGEGTGV